MSSPPPLQSPEQGPGRHRSKRRAWAGRLLGLLLSAEDRRVLESELAELHERRVRVLGVKAADRRLQQERRGMLWHFLAARLLPAPPSPTHRRERTMWTNLRIDLADVVRTFRRHPRFVAGVSLALGIGVGSVVAVFSMANQLLLRPLPGAGDPEGAAFLEFTSLERRALGVSGPDLEALRGAATLLEGFASYDNVMLQASVGGTRPVAVQGYTVYGDYFEVLGVRPLLGRLLTAEESGPEADPLVAVISENLWERLFDRSPDVVGRQIDARGHAFTVVGVAAGRFRGTDLTSPVDAWLPRSAFAPLEAFPLERLGSRESRLNQWFLVRVRPGVALEAAQLELDALVANLAGSGEGAYLSGVRATLHRGFPPAWVTEQAHRTLVVLGGASGLLLILTCANVANMLLVRGVQGRADAAVRRALGASLGRLARRRLLEALLLGTTGTLTGLGVAALVALLFRGMRVPGLPGFQALSVDVRVVAFASCAVLVTALLSGTLPAILAGRFDVTDTLRDGGDRSTSRHGVVRSGISALQIGLSLMLLIGSLLLVNTVRNVYAVDAGLALDGVTALTFDMERDLPDLAELDARHREILDAVRSVPGVQAAALHGWYGPFSDGMLSTRIARTEEPDLALEAGIQWVTPGWFELFEVSASSGRTFREADWSGASPMPVVITAPLAEQLFGQQDAVGRTVLLGQRTQINEVEIVGVVSNVRSVDLRRAPDEAVFVPYPTQRALLPTLTLLFRASDPAAIPAVQRAVEAVVPHLPVPEPAPLTERVDTQLAEQRVFARLLTLLAGIAVVLSVFGVYGVIAFAVAGRRREFGIRIALGADGARIRRLVLQSAVWIVLLGTTSGLAGAYYLSGLLESRLFGVAAVDGASYSGAAALLALVAALACWSPARSAGNTDPVTTLKAR